MYLNHHSLLKVSRFIWPFQNCLCLDKIEEFKDEPDNSNRFNLKNSNEIAISGYLKSDIQLINLKLKNNSGVDSDSNLGVSGLEEIMNENEGDRMMNSNERLDEVKNFSHSLSQHSEFKSNNVSMLKIINDNNKRRFRPQMLKVKSWNEGGSKNMPRFYPENKKIFKNNLSLLMVKKRSSEDNGCWIPPSSTFLEFENLDKEEFDSEIKKQVPKLLQIHSNNLKSLK